MIPTINVNEQNENAFIYLHFILYSYRNEGHRYKHTDDKGEIDKEPLFFSCNVL